MCGRDITLGVAEAQRNIRAGRQDPLPTIVVKVWLSTLRLEGPLHPSICAVLPQGTPLGLGHRDFSLNRVPIIGIKSELLEEGLKPTRLSHHHTGLSPSPHPFPQLKPSG